MPSVSPQFFQKNPSQCHGKEVDRTPSPSNVQLFDIFERHIQVLALCDRLGLVDQVFSSTWESLHIVDKVNQSGGHAMLQLPDTSPYSNNTRKNRTSPQKHDTQITSGSTLYICSYIYICYSTIQHNVQNMIKRIKHVRFLHQEKSVE